MEAQVRPLPSELTTPPVTKMCFVCLAVVSLLFGKVVASLGSPESAPPPYYTRWPDERQRRPRRTVFTRPSCGATLPILPPYRHESLIVVVGIYARRTLCNDAHLDAPAVGEDAQLFQFF